MNVQFTILTLGDGNLREAEQNLNFNLGPSITVVDETGSRNLAFSDK